MFAVSGANSTPEFSLRCIGIRVIPVESPALHADADNHKTMKYIIATIPRAIGRRHESCPARGTLWNPGT